VHSANDENSAAAHGGPERIVRTTAAICAIRSIADERDPGMAFTKSLQKGQRTWLHLVLSAIFVMAAPSSGFAQDATTTIYIVRHAERLDSTADSPLAEKGFARANELAHVLQDAGLTAIFVSMRKRTRQTAEPTADATGIEIRQSESPEATVNQILTGHLGGRILVVGHSDSVDDIGEGLGVNGVPELDTQQYDRLFIVHRIGNEAHMHALRYGEATD
jgi:phosphohistidine phosphatase SixA